MIPYEVDMTEVRQALAKKRIYPRSWSDYFRAVGEYIRRRYCEIDRLNKRPIREECPCQKS